MEAITNSQLIDIFETRFKSKEIVYQFGQPIDNPNLKECPKDLIETKEVLTQLHNSSIEVYHDDDIYMGELEEINGVEVEETADIGNTYNWSAPIQNDINWRAYKEVTGDNIVFEVAIHNGYGDIRGGYGEIFYFVIDENKSFVELLSELELCKSVTIDNLYFDFDIFSENGCYNIYDSEAGTDIDYEKYIGDIDDIKEYVNNYKKQTDKV